jgi:hypothetical protein
LKEALKVRNIMAVIPLFQSLTLIMFATQGRRVSLRSTLAPGYHISRLWRCAQPDSDYLCEAVLIHRLRRFIQKLAYPERVIQR